MTKVFTAAGALEHGDGSLITGGVFTIVVAPSVKVSVEGSGVFRGTISYIFSGGSDDTDPAPIFVDGSIATLLPQTILPTAIKVKADGSFVIRDGDTGIMACVGTLLVGGTSSIGGPVVCVAAQTKVDAL